MTTPRRPNGTASLMGAERRTARLSASSSAVRSRRARCHSAPLGPGEVSRRPGPHFGRDTSNFESPTLWLSRVTGVPVLVRAALFDLLAGAPSGQRLRRDALPPRRNGSRLVCTHHLPNIGGRPIGLIGSSGAEARERSRNEGPVLQLSTQQRMLAQCAAPGFDHLTLGIDQQATSFGPVACSARLL
jgi:hypothetical protein